MARPLIVVLVSMCLTASAAALAEASADHALRDQTAAIALLRETSASYTAADSFAARGFVGGLVTIGLTACALSMMPVMASGALMVGGLTLMVGTAVAAMRARNRDMERLAQAGILDQELRSRFHSLAVRLAQGEVDEETLPETVETFLREAALDAHRRLHVPSPGMVSRIVGGFNELNGRGSRILCDPSAAVEP